MDLFGFFRRKSRVSEAAPASREDDRGWSRASAVGTGSPLNPDRDELHGEALLNAAYLAYHTNPLAFAIIEQSTAFVLGGGVQIVARNRRVQAAIDRFWFDPQNNMPLTVYDIYTELCVFGEQFLRFFADPVTGHTVLRQLDPLYITNIQTHPEDLRHPVQYLYNPPPGPAGSSGSAIGGTWIPAKDVLHVSLNKVSSALRGRSDLGPILPWLRRYTEWLENRTRLHKLTTNLLWDITVVGGSQEDITRLRALYATPPPPGTVLVHNETQQWKALLPEIHGMDAAPDGRAIRLMVATGAILPEHFLSEGGNANRATAAEMGVPTIKRFKRRQRFFRAVLTSIINRVLDEAQRAGRFGPRTDRSFSVEMEEISDLPPVATAEALDKFARALAVAVEKQLVTADEARRLWLRFANMVDDTPAQPDAPDTSP